MVIPKIVTQVKLLITHLPEYMDNLNKRVTDWIGEHGAQNGENSTIDLASCRSVAAIDQQHRTIFVEFVQQYSEKIFFFCLVAYMLMNPNRYCSCTCPVFRRRRKRRLRRHSPMLRGYRWLMWSNVVAGGFRSVIVWFFLYFMNIPGVWVCGPVLHFC